jgi:hypothetical protein
LDSIVIPPFWDVNDLKHFEAEAGAFWLLVGLRMGAMASFASMIRPKWKHKGW